MLQENIKNLLSTDELEKMFPKERSNEFFEALLGDADEGAYDIELAYGGNDGESIHMELRLHERPGRCLACNLTQGLPQVFSRHPLLNIQGVVDDVNTLLDGQAECKEWQLGFTEQRQKNMHIIPLTIALA